MEKCIWYTGFMDAFLCFELLEHANIRLKHSETIIPLNHLFLFRWLFDYNFLFRELSDACVFGIIEGFEIQERPEGSVIPTSIRILGATEIQEIEKKNSIWNSASHLLEAEFNAGKYIALHINPENIRSHLDNILWEWRRSVSFADINPSINYFTTKKQESIITDFLSKKEKEELDMSSINLKIDELFDNGELNEWFIDKNGEEPIVWFNPFIALWSLQEKHILNINFWATVLWNSEELIYNISMRKTIWSEEKSEQHTDRREIMIHLPIDKKKIRFDGVNLIMGDQNIELWAYQMKLCEYFFTENPNDEILSRAETIDYIYGENQWQYDEKFKNLYTVVNRKARSIGGPSLLFSSIGGSKIRISLISP